MKTKIRKEGAVDEKSSLADGARVVYDPTPNDLLAAAEVRLKEAEVLFDAGQYDGSKYLCGYAVEMALKAHICLTLGWVQFPPGKRESFRSFFTHDLEILLKLSGRMVWIHSNHLEHWSKVVTWTPEDRYNPVGTVDVINARTMLKSTAAVLKAL